MANQPQKKPTGKPTAGTPAGKPASKPVAAKPAQATKPATPPATARPQVGAARVGGGIQRRRRDPNRTLREENKSIPKGDYTVTSKNIQSEVALVKPTWKEGQLIVRPLPGLNPDAANEGRRELDGYRYSTDLVQFMDWTRKYPGVDYIGIKGSTPATFNLWDPATTEDGYDSDTNPYVLLWKAVDDAIYKSKTHTQWLDLIDNKAAGNRPALKPVCYFYYFQGLVYRRGTTNFFGQGKLPRGIGPKDYTQVIRLKNSAGKDLYDMLNMLNPDWDGDPTDYENSMLYGDPVSPQHGRFITVYNAKAGENTAHLQSELEGLEGSLDVGDAADDCSGNDDEKRGYTVELHEVLTVNGVASKMTAHYSEKVVGMFMPKLVWLEEVIHVPSHEEQCVYIARAIPRKDVLSYAWADWPEYLNIEEVQKVLKRSKSVAVNRTQDASGELDAATSSLLDEFAGAEFDMDPDAVADEGVDVVTDDVDTGEDYADEYDQTVDDAAEGEYEEAVEGEEGEYAEEAVEEEAEYEEAVEGDEEVAEEAEYEEAVEGDEAEYAEEEELSDEAGDGEFDAAEEGDGEYDYEDPDDQVAEEPAEEAAEVEETPIDEDADAQEALAGLAKARQRSAGRPAAAPPTPAKTPAKPSAKTPAKTPAKPATPPKAATPAKPGKPAPKKK